MKRLLCLVAVFALSGCAAISKVEQGDQVVAGRMAVKLEGPWNHLENMAGIQVPTWTVEGITVDRLQFFVGIKDGRQLVNLPAGQNKQLVVFQASMEPHQLVSLFEAMLTADGSTFALERADPAPFLGGQGIRFQYSLIRRIDDVRLSGLGYARIVDGELYAILYQAPRLGFYPRYQAQVERMAQTASLRSGS